MVLKVAIIGTGIFATQKHLPAIESTPKIQLVGCYNRTTEKAEKFAAEASGNIRVYHCIEDLLADPGVDVIDALLPVDQNLSIVQNSLAAGKPICFEKPIAATLEDAERIVQLAESTDIPVMVLENWCYLHGTQRLQAEISQIGQITHFSLQASGPFRFSPYHGTTWRQSPKHIGGFLSDAGVHDLALLTEVLGPVSTVSAHTTQVNEASGAVDTLSALLKLDSGVFGTYTQSRYAGAAEPTLTFQIFGTLGSFVYTRPFPDQGQLKTFLRTESGASTNKTELLPEDTLNGVTAEFGNWAEVLESKDTGRLVSTPRKAYHHYAVIVAAVESGERNGAPVVVKKLPESFS